MTRGLPASVRAVVLAGALVASGRHARADEAARTVGFLALGVGATYPLDDVTLAEGDPPGVASAVGVTVDLEIEVPAFTPWLILGGGLVWSYVGPAEGEESWPSTTGIDLGPGVELRPAPWLAVIAAPHFFVGWEETHRYRCESSGPVCVGDKELHTGLGVGALGRLGAFAVLGTSLFKPLVGVELRLIAATRPADFQMPLSQAAALIFLGIGG